MAVRLIKDESQHLKMIINNQFDYPLNQRLICYYIMKHFQLPKVNKSPPPILNTPFEQSIVELQIQRLHSYFKVISQKQHKKGQEIQKQIHKDLELLSAKQQKKGILKGFLFNIKAIATRDAHHDHKKAMKYLEKAEKELGKGHTLDLARVALSKSLILFDQNQLEKANAIAKEAISDLTNSRSYKNIRMNPQMAELNINIFVFLASEFKKFSKPSESKQIFKQGYLLADNVLGPHHKLTRTLKLQVKESKYQSEFKQKRQNSQYQSVKSKLASDNCKTNKIIKDDSKNFLPQNSKEKQIHRIYKGRENRIKTESAEGWNTNDQDFLTTLWKVKHIYRKCPTEQGSHLDSKESLKEGPFHAKARQILLKGRTINKDILLSQDKSESAEIKTLEKSIISVSLQPSKAEPQPEKIRIQDSESQPQPLGISGQLSKTTNPQTSKSGDDCQLI